MHWKDLAGLIPTDHSRQVTASYYVERVLNPVPASTVVLDFGCGVGSSLAEFRDQDPRIRWIGLDVGDSREAGSRKPLDAPVVLFDGERIPLADACVDVVYSRQVFEHVRRPHLALSEIGRILRPGGRFAGSTSQLEPYHSRSYWGGFTIPGFCALLRDAGLTAEEVRPGIDALTLIERAFLDEPPSYGEFFSSESPLNRKIDQWAKETGRGHGAVNNRKLRFCGQFSFLARKPG